MAQGNAQLSKKLEEQGGKPTPLALQQKLVDWQVKHGANLIKLAGGEEEKANKLFTVCLGTLTRNVELLECTFASITTCLLKSFELDLFPGAFGECAYVPLNNKNIGQKEANFWPMYQGLTKLMRNAGNRMVVARVVYENDYFEYHEGERAPVYVPAVILGKKRGARLFTYAAVQTRDGSWQVEVMSPEQVEVIRSRSRRGNAEPWTSKYEDDVNAMWAKTVLKRLSKWVTKSAELVSAIELDNEIDGDENIKKPARIIDLQSLSETPMQEPEAPKQIDHTPRESVELKSDASQMAEVDRKAAEESGAKRWSE